MLAVTPIYVITRHIGAQTEVYRVVECDRKKIKEYVHYLNRRSDRCHTFQYTTTQKIEL